MSLSLSLLIVTLFFFALTIGRPHHHPPPSTATGITSQARQAILDVHNQARASVGVGPISWNHTLEAYAQNYANQRIRDCQLEHSMGPYGENLAEGYGQMDGGDAVKFWMTEKGNYDYATNSCVGDECLHYTQVVWSGSVRLGCGSVKCDNGWVFFICSYDLPGNMEGQRPY